MDKKALFFDLDGTLIDDETKILPKSTIEAIRKVREKGNKVFLNSGRVISMLSYLFKDIVFDGVVAGCGTYIELDNKLIYENKNPLSECNKVKRALLENKVEAFLEAKDKVYMGKRPFLYKEMELVYNIIKEIADIKLDAFIDETYTFDKFCMLADPVAQKESIKNIVKASEICFDILDRGSKRGAGFFEFVPKNHSKAKGIERVLEFYGISYENTYVFGDSLNDLSMFKSPAKYKIVPKEHDEILSSYATFISKKVLDDGIVHAMKYYNLV